MSALTVRNLPDETHRALKLRAAQHGRSTEAEVRHILESAVRPKVGLGSALDAIGRGVGGLELDLQRDPSCRKAVAGSSWRRLLRGKSCPCLKGEYCRSMLKRPELSARFALVRRPLGTRLVLSMGLLPRLRLRKFLHW